LSSTGAIAAITKKSSAVLLVLAVVLSAVGSFGIIRGNRAMVRSLPVVIAKVDIEPHTRITADMLDVQEYARGLIKKGMLSDTQGAADRINRTYIPAGTPVYTQQLALPGDNTLTTQLSEMGKPEFRAKSLPVEPIFGLNGRLKPGDRVDLIGAMRVPLKGQQTLISHTFAKNVEIIELMGDAVNMRGITVAVNPQQAQDMDFVINNGGKVGIALRPYDAADVVTDPTTPESFMAKLFVASEQNQNQEAAAKPNTQIGQ
jgi:pilus assembly protein CpaB